MNIVQAERKILFFRYTSQKCLLLATLELMVATNNMLNIQKLKYVTCA